VECLYDAKQKEYVLTLEQSCPSVAGQPDKKPFFIPVAVALLDAEGGEMQLQLAGEKQEKSETAKILHFKEKKQKFVFKNIFEEPVLSFLRNFSAPVKVNRNIQDAELSFLMAHDSDSFNRWDAGQQLGLKFLLEQIFRQQQGEHPLLPDVFVSSVRSLLADTTADPAFKALALELPSENWISQQMNIVDPSAVFQIRKFFYCELGRCLKDIFLALYLENCSQDIYVYNPEAAGRRSLKNICLDYLLQGEAESGAGAYLIDVGVRQYHEATNMTDVFAALRSIVNVSRTEGDKLLADFFEKWQDAPLVVDKWLTLQASCILPETLERVKRMTAHPAFSIKNPNKVRALIATFCSVNQSQFHGEDGAGYSFLVDIVLELNAINPQIAARMLTPLTMWRRYDLKRQNLMRLQLERVRNFKNISPDVEEIITKSLFG
jgi:aminopeptidase N